MRWGTVCVATILGCVLSAWADDLEIRQTNAPATEDFARFAGTYDTLPDGFAVSQDGETLMTSTHVDFRGLDDGGVGTGGCYAWQLDTNDCALGYQPTAEEFTPGFFRLCVRNGTRWPVDRVRVAYDVVWRNDQKRSQRLDLAWSRDGTNFTTVADTEFVTPRSPDPEPAWHRTPLLATVTLPRILAPGDRLWLHWRGDDAGGSYSRDEYGIDNVSITLQRGPGLFVEVK